VPVILPAVQADFGVSRAEASTPYSLLMVGYGVGGFLMGRAADRYGLLMPLLVGATCLGAGYVVAAQAQDMTTFVLAHAVLMGLAGSSVTFSPLLADTSMWWVRRRGIAVAVCASGNYLGGAIWPPVVQHFVEAAGWRATYTWMGIGCSVAMLLLAAAMRRRPPALPESARSTGEQAARANRPFGLTPTAATVLLPLGPRAPLGRYAVEHGLRLVRPGQIGHRSYSLRSQKMRRRSRRCKRLSAPLGLCPHAPDRR